MKVILKAAILGFIFNFLTPSTVLANEGETKCVMPPPPVDKTIKLSAEESEIFLSYIHCQTKEFEERQKIRDQEYEAKKAAYEKDVDEAKIGFRTCIARYIPLLQKYDTRSIEISNFSIQISDSKKTFTLSPQGREEMSFKYPKEIKTYKEVSESDFLEFRILNETSSTKFMESLLDRANEEFSEAKMNEILKTAKTTVAQVQNGTLNQKKACDSVNALMLAAEYFRLNKSTAENCYYMSKTDVFTSDKLRQSSFTLVNRMIETHSNLLEQLKSVMPLMDANYCKHIQLPIFKDKQDILNNEFESIKFKPIEKRPPSSKSVI
jgi:hypothetical protein